MIRATPKNFPSLARTLRQLSRLAFVVAAASLVAATWWCVSGFWMPQKDIAPPMIQAGKDPVAAPTHATSQRAPDVFARRGFREVAPPPPPVAVAQSQPAPPPKPPEVELVATMTDDETHPQAFVRVKGAKSMTKVFVGGQIEGYSVVEIREGALVLEGAAGRITLHVRRES